MSLSDCIKCWGTPCICGHDYMWMTDEQFATWIEKITEGREKHKKLQEELAEAKISPL